LARDLQAVFGKLKRRLRQEAQLGDLSLSQVLVLSHLDREGAATVTSLARIEGVRPQSMGATVASLEAAGLVRGASHPTDGRQTLWSLTAAGKAHVKAKRAALEDWLFRAIRTHLNAAEQVELARAIDLLQRLVER